LHSSTADSDGFLIATVSIENMNGDYKLYGRVTGIGYDLGSAAVNWVSGQDYPILSNSFTMPVRKGETWEVWFYSEPVQNQHQHYSIYWIPLGQH
ncbi:MAG: hypothetical protein JXB15_02945, partial [Anaerolineales bacterium]|nr:hypothetical protein [Anaerolineales bacterium]